MAIASCNRAINNKNKFIFRVCTSPYYLANKGNKERFGIYPLSRQLSIIFFDLTLRLDQASLIIGYFSQRDVLTLNDTNEHIDKASKNKSVSLKMPE